MHLPWARTSLSLPFVRIASPTLWRNRYRLLAVLALITGLLVAKGWQDTLADPTVRRTEVALRGMPANAEPVRAVLVSDIHVAGPDMPPERLARIVAQINALQPDIVLIAGDLVSEKRLATRIYTPEEIVAPLGGLEARLGVVFAPGNHDHWYDWSSLEEQLTNHGIRVLQNDAAEFGSLAIGGVDDAYTRRDDLPIVLTELEGLRGGRIILTHSPDIFPQLPPDISLVLAGHTHCGQISLPFIGPLTHMSRYGERFACGHVVENEQSVIVGAGLGTSLLPLRFGTRPEVWLVTLMPE